MIQVSDSQRIIIVGNETSVRKAGLPPELEDKIHLTGSLEEAAALRAKDENIRVLVDPDFLKASGFDLLPQQTSPAVHERERLDFKLENHRLHCLFDSAPAGMAIFGAAPPYKVLSHNRMYQQFWSEPFHSQGIVGKHILDFVPPAQVNDVSEAIQEISKTRHPKTIREIPSDELEQGRTWWNWIFSPVVHGGEVVAFTHTLIEITDRVLAREQVE